MEEYENYQDIKYGAVKLKKMTYMELVEDLNKDMKVLTAMDSPLTVYKDEKATLAEVQKKQEDTLQKVKMVSYPFWTIMTVLNCLLLIGYYYQDKTIDINKKKRDRIEKNVQIAASMQ